MPPSTIHPPSIPVANDKQFVLLGRHFAVPFCSFCKSISLVCTIPYLYSGYHPLSSPTWDFGGIAGSPTPRERMARETRNVLKQVSAWRENQDNGAYKSYVSLDVPVVRTTHPACDAPYWCDSDGWVDFHRDTSQDKWKKQLYEIQFGFDNVIEPSFLECIEVNRELSATVA